MLLMMQLCLSCLKAIGGGVGGTQVVGDFNMEIKI